MANDSIASAELEAKLLKRRQKCEGTAISPPSKKGNRVWNDELAKTVSQQRRARLAAQGSDANCNPQDVDTVPPSVSSASSSSSRRKGRTLDSTVTTSSRKKLFWASSLVVCCLLGFLVSRQAESNSDNNSFKVFEDTEVPLDDVFANHTAEPELPQEAPEIEAEVAKGPDGSAEEDEERIPFDQEHFNAIVKESEIQPHHSSIAADTRAPRDLTDEWWQFLSENPTIGQVYRLGRLTVTESSSRSVGVTVNITLTNRGQSSWPARTTLQLAHGADMGIEGLQLGRVTEPGADQKVSLHLKVPRTKVASPTCIWALSLDGRVFGVLLLLELDAQIESRSSGLLGQASDILLSAKVAKVQGVRLQSQDEALQHDPARAGDVTEEWSADLVSTSVTQAYRLGSIVVTEAARKAASLDIFLALENSGQDPWPEGTELKLVSGKALGFESIELDTPVDAGSHINLIMPLKIPVQDLDRNILQESVWALSVAGHSFGPLLILELRTVE